MSNDYTSPSKIAKYRKGVIAVLAAVVTVAAAFDISLAADLSDKVVGVFDALAAAAVIIVPNKPQA